MTVISQDSLAEHQERIPQDLQKSVPNLQFSGNVTIRGIGDTPGSAVAGSQPGVATITDGLLWEETGGGNITSPFFDLQDIEVLKGPQGTFVGAASTAGAIEINSKKPVLGANLDGYIDAQYGNYADVKIDGAVNLPITDTLAARLAFNEESRNSFYRDVNGDLASQVSTEISIDPGAFDIHEARLSFLYKPTDSFQAYLKTEYDLSTGFGPNTQPNLFTFTNPVSGVVSHSPFYAYYSGSPFVLNQVGVQTSASLYVPTLLDLKYTLPDDIVLRSLTGYTYSYSRQAGETGYTSDNTGYSTQDVQPDWSWTQEFDVLSPTMWRTSFVAGAIFNYRFTPARNFIENFLPPYSVANPQTTLADFATTVRGEGLFGNVVFQWTPTLQATVGLRENWDNEFNGGLGSIITSPSPPLAVATVHQVLSAGHESDSAPTGKVGLNWTPIPGQFLYAFASKGYKSGGVATSGVSFEPESVYDYELGWKGRLFDGRVLAQFGGFYMDYFKQQEQVFSTSGAGTYIGNLAGTTKIDGFELSAQSRFENLGINLSLGYTESKLGSFTEVASYELPAVDQAGIPQCTGSGGTAPPPAPCFNFNRYLITLSGEAEPLSPKLTVSSDVNYIIRIGGDGNTLRPMVFYTYQSLQYASLIQIPYNSIPARGVWGATLGYRAGPWLAQLYAKNLANLTYISGNSGNDVYYGSPRQFGIRLSRTFQ
jgi:iron complex outermembrane receptor protein